MKQNRRWEVIYNVDFGLIELTWEDVQSLSVKTLSIAAGKVDDVEAVRRMGIYSPPQQAPDELKLLRLLLHFIRDADGPVFQQKTTLTAQPGRVTG
ncbi:hypothetical protein G7046_g3520 [Stylonectria norvegica]|nr:hypothetical protein G7046_g3520 [Stylonectria norvegica]